MAKKGQIKHFAACAIAGMSALSAAAALSSCDISMEKEAGYTEGQLYAVEAEFSKIRIDAKGGIALSISYGGDFSVSYAESEQEKFTFSVEDETLVVVQRRTIGSLLDYKSKALNIVVPAANKIASLTADIEGQIDCTLQGEYGLLAFDVDGPIPIKASAACCRRQSCTWKCPLCSRSPFSCWRRAFCWRGWVRLRRGWREGGGNETGKYL